MFDVWDCADEFQAFVMTLMPTLAEEQIEMAPAEPLEIHRLIEGGAATFQNSALSWSADHRAHHADTDGL